PRQTRQIACSVRMSQSTRITPRLSVTGQIWRSQMRRNTGSAILLCLALTTTQASAQQPQSLIPVGTLAAELRPITRAAEFVGRVEAMARVEIRARVGGFLEDVRFKEGDL